MPLIEQKRIASTGFYGSSSLKTDGLAVWHLLSVLYRRSQDPESTPGQVFYH
jgi:hypothetical protein